MVGHQLMQDIYKVRPREISAVSPVTATEPRSACTARGSLFTCSFLNVSSKLSQMWWIHLSEIVHKCPLSLIMKTAARTTRVCSPGLQRGLCWDPSVPQLGLIPTGDAGLNWSHKTEAPVGINCCKSGAQKITISFWLTKFSGIDDPVLASTKWIYSPSCWREERLSLPMCLQPACPVHSSLFLDVSLNTCGGQRAVTGCDTPSDCQEGSLCLCCKLHRGLLGTTEPLEFHRRGRSIQPGDATEGPRGSRSSHQDEGSSSRSRNNSQS